MDIYLHTERLRGIERYRRIDLGHMKVQFLIEYSGAFAKSWKINMVWDVARYNRRARK